MGGFDDILGTDSPGFGDLFMTPEERLRSMRERFPNALPGLGDGTSEKEDDPSYFPSWLRKVGTTSLSGITGAARMLANRLDPLRGAQDPLAQEAIAAVKKVDPSEVRRATGDVGELIPPLSRASERVEVADERAKERLVAASADLPPWLAGAGFWAAEVAGGLLDPGELLPGGVLAEGITRGARAITRGRRVAGAVAEAAPELARGLRAGERAGKGLSEGAVSSWIERLGTGERGLSSTTIDGAEAVVYRGPDGRAVSAAVLSPDGNTVDLVFKDKTRGVLGDRAAVRVGRELNRRGISGTTGEVSEEALRFRDRLTETRGKPIGSSGRLRPPDDPFQYNATSLDVPDTALPEIRETMKRPETLARRRTGVEIDYNDPARLQAEVGMTEDDFLKAPAGTVWNREQSALLESYVGRVGRKLEDLRASGLTDTAEFADLKTRWIDLLGTSMAGRTEAGRAFESFKHLRTALDSPESLRTYLARKVGRANGGKLTDAEVDILAKTDLDDPGELAALISKIQKPKWWEYPRELFYSSILSGLGTHMRNTVGNAMHAASQIPVRIGAAIVDAPLAKLAGRQRERYLREVLPSAHGLLEGFSDGLVRFRESVRRGITPGVDRASMTAGKFDVPRSAFARAPNRFVRERVAPVVNIPFTFLNAADELFKGINRGAELRALATRSGLQKGLAGEDLVDHVARFMADPPAEALKRAVEFEQKMTFTNPLGTTAKHLENLKNSSPFLGYLVPFVRTPVNLFKRGIEFTPLNLPRAVMMGRKGAAEAADEIAKVAVGTGMMGLVGMKAAAGEVVGPPPAEAAERDAFYQSGKQPFSVRFGDRWYSFSQIEPLAMPLALVASAHEGWRRGEGDATNFERMQKAMSLLLANQLDRSYLSGLSDLVELKTFGDQALVGFAGRQAAAMGVPFSGAMRTLANLDDPRIVEKRRLQDYFMENIPGLKRKLPARLTRFGEEIRKTRWQAAGPSGTPLVPTKATDDEVEQGLEELGLTVGFPGKSIEGMQLSPEEYRAYLAEVGPKTKEVLRFMLSDESFRQFPQEMQQKMVASFVQNTRDVARAEAMMGLVPDIPPLMVKKQLSGAAESFNSARSRLDGISARYNERTRRRGQASVDEMFAAGEEAEQAWTTSYGSLQRAARDAARQGLTERQIFDLLRRQGLSERLARTIVRGETMGYQDYRDGRE